MRNFKLRLKSRASASSQEVSCSCDSKKLEHMRRMKIEQFSPNVKTVSLEVLSHVIPILRLPDHAGLIRRVCKFRLIFQTQHL